MKKYLVKLYYTTMAEYEVEAEDEDEALQQARETDDGGQLLSGLQENSYDVEEITGD